MSIPPWGIAIPAVLADRMRSAGMIDPDGGITEKGLSAIALAVELMHPPAGKWIAQPIKTAIAGPLKIVVLRYPVGQEDMARELAGKAEKGEVVLLPNSTDEDGSYLWQLSING